jgi:hypothetical protein
MVTQTILHLSHSGLPDARIERIAVMAKSYGRSVFLGPPGRRTTLFSDSFDSIIFTNAFSTLGNLGLPAFYQSFIQRLSKVVQNIQPAFIYAHNIMAAKAAYDLSIPFIYDDHEYWSRQATLRRIGRFSIHTAILNLGRYFLAPRLWRKWEAQVLASSVTTVTVSEAIAKEHRKRGADCVVIPNIPLQRELAHQTRPSLHSGQLHAISLASDFQGFLEHRQPGNNLDVWEKEGGILMDWVGRPPSRHFTWIRHRQWIEPNQLLRVLAADYQIGFIPWAKNWYHRYSLPSKTAWYAHAGLIFLLGSDYLSLIEFLPEGSYFAFENDAHLVRILRKIRNFSKEEILSIRLRLQDWAQKNAVLDTYRDTFESIMKLANETSQTSARR